nr:hypothetical protein [Sphingomonas sp. ZFBP2030]
MAILKVYRTPIGFHDAYVAAPSQKAALAAWGTTHNLFARGVAEIVTDPELTAEALAAPGTVIKRSRGTAAEQIAALPPDAPRAKAAAPKPVKRKPAAPRPHRKPLDAAEAAIAQAKERHDAAARDLAARLAALQEERQTLDRDHRAEIARLEEARERVAAVYEEATKAWRG